MSNFHLNCAYLSECSLRISKSNVKHKNFNQNYLSCHLHKDEQGAKVVNNLENFKCEKCYIIDTNDELYRKKNPFPKFKIDTTHRNTKQSANGPYMLIGSLRINNLGELDTISDNSECLFPINYACSRLYWSTIEIGKKVSYKCRIITTSMLKSETMYNQKNSTEEITNKFPTFSTLKFDMDGGMSNCEENVITEPFETLPQQVDGQNDSLEENSLKPNFIMNTINQTSNTVNNFAQNFVQPSNQSKCIIRMPNNQTLISNLNQVNQATRILSYNPSNPTILQTNPKVFNISSQFKNFSNVKTGSSNPPVTSSAQSDFTEKPPVIRIENPPMIRFENPLQTYIPKSTSNSNATLSQPKKTKASVKKSIFNLNNNKNTNHFKSLEVVLFILFYLHCK